jgi:GNAT superfamily N-acetyltransferase
MEEKKDREFPVKAGLPEYFSEGRQRVLRSWFLNKRFIDVTSVYTLPKFQRRGVGTALMKWANDFASSYFC